MAQWWLDAKSRIIITLRKWTRNQSCIIGFCCLAAIVFMSELHEVPQASAEWKGLFFKVIFVPVYLLLSFYLFTWPFECDGLQEFDEMKLAFRKYKSRMHLIWMMMVLVTGVYVLLPGFFFLIRGKDDSAIKSDEPELDVCPRVFDSFAMTIDDL